jgi:hypothetical protein
MKIIVFHLMEQFEYFKFAFRHFDIFVIEMCFLLFFVICFLNFSLYNDNKFNFINYVVKYVLQMLFGNLKLKYKNEDFFISQFFVFYSFFFIVFS